jgi:hypothetical protein
MDTGTGGPSRRGDAPQSLETVCAELNELLLEDVELDGLLRRLAELAASLVPGTRCVINVRRDAAERAAQSAATRGRPEASGIPGQRLPHSPGGDDPAHQRAGADSPGSGASIPLVVNGVEIGVLRLFADSSRAFSEAELGALRDYTRLAAPAVMLVLRQSARLVLDDQLQEAVVTRAVIDQALGVLMHARRISSPQAMQMLRQASQLTNRKVSEIAADVIQTLTGHPPEPPRPLSPSRTAHVDDPNVW